MCLQLLSDDTIQNGRQRVCFKIKKMIKGCLANCKFIIMTILLPCINERHLMLMPTILLKYRLAGLYGQVYMNQSIIFQIHGCYFNLSVTGPRLG